MKFNELLFSKGSFPLGLLLKLLVLRTHAFAFTRRIIPCLFVMSSYRLSNLKFYLTSLNKVSFMEIFGKTSNSDSLARLITPLEAKQTRKL